MFLSISKQSFISRNSAKLDSVLLRYDILFSLLTENEAGLHAWAANCCGLGTGKTCVLMLASPLTLFDIIGQQV